MKTRRTAHRYRFALLLTLSVGLALGSFWLLQFMNRGDGVTTPQARSDQPDYYVEKFNFVRLSKTGDARYNVSGERMIHRPLDDTYEITLPVVHSLSPDRPPLTLRAQKAIAVPDSSKIHMMERVVAERPAAAGSSYFNLKSEYLLILPDEDVIQTDKAVDLTLGTNRLAGIGMVANNATREFRLAQQVRAVLPPR